MPMMERVQQGFITTFFNTHSRVSRGNFSRASIKIMTFLGKLLFSGTGESTGCCGGGVEQGGDALAVALDEEGRAEAPSIICQETIYI
nr:hypothetical protein Itr_chr12CG19590 [Ipomoea trifida]